MTDTLVVDHNAGFFSCCSVKLYSIIDYYNRYNKLPDKIEASKQFYNYKVDPENSLEDVNSLFFKDIQSNIIINSNPPIDYHHDHQFTPYKHLEFDKINPFIEKYFSISAAVEQFTTKIETKYNIDYNNTAAVFYRGNDKCTETGIASYDDFISKCNEIYIKDNNIRFLVQTDELEFKNAFCSTFKNSFAVEEMPLVNKNQRLVIHHIIDKSDRPKFGIRVLGITVCISKAKHIITHSGNCGIWSVLYRGNANNVYQYLRHTNTDNFWLHSI